MPRLKAKHSLCSYIPRMKSLAFLPQEPGLLSALPGALQSSAAVQELGTQFSEASSKVWVSTVPPQISHRKADSSALGMLIGAGACSVLQNGSGEVLWGSLSVLLTPTLKTHSFPSTFPTEKVEFPGEEAACAPCHPRGHRPWGQWLSDTYTSTPVEWRELCQFTGRNSTRPTCCCSWAFLKCACSMLSETFLKSFTGKEKSCYGDPPGSEASPWHQHHLIP